MLPSPSSSGQQQLNPLLLNILECAFSHELAGRLECELSRGSSSDLQVAVLQQALAETMIRNRDLPQAESILRNVILIRKAKQGEDHHMVTAAMHRLVDVLLLRSKVGEAAAWLSEIVEACGRTVGLDHSDTHRAQTSLAEVYMDQDGFAESEKLLTDVMNSCFRQFGQQHNATLTAQSKLARCYLKKGTFAKALRLFNTVREERVQLLGPRHLDCLNDSLLTAECLQKMRKVRDAEIVLKDCLVHCEHTEQEQEGDARSSDDLLTVRCCGMLGTLYLTQNKFDLAQAFLSRSHRNLVRLLGVAHPDTRAIEKKLSLCANVAESIS